MSAAARTSIRLAIALAAGVALVALLWGATALAQTAYAAPTQWLTPQSVYGGLSLLGTALLFIVRWSLKQDRRIDEAATKESLRAIEKRVDGAASASDLNFAIKGIKDAVADLGRVVMAAQSRDACAQLREAERGEMADLERSVGARLTVLERKVDRIDERTASSSCGLDDLRHMVSTLYQAGGFAPLTGPRPTNPDKEG